MSLNIIQYNKINWSVRNDIVTSRTPQEWKMLWETAPKVVWKQRAVSILPQRTQDAWEISSNDKLQYYSGENPH